MSDPPSIQAYCKTGEIETAQNMQEITEAIRRLEPLRPVRRFAEVGVLYGGSAMRYAEALCSPGAADLFLIDVDLPRFAPAASALRIHFNVHCLLTHEATPALLKSLDLLHIDADHSYPAVKHDYETFAPFVRKGGAIVLHDVCGKAGVIMFWAELQARGLRTETIRISYGPGIGIVWV